MSLTPEILGGVVAMIGAIALLWLLIAIVAFGRFRRGQSLASRQQSASPGPSAGRAPSWNLVRDRKAADNSLRTVDWDFPLGVRTRQGDDDGSEVSSADPSRPKT